MVEDLSFHARMRIVQVGFLSHQTNYLKGAQRYQMDLVEADLQR